MQPCGLYLLAFLLLSSTVFLPPPRSNDLNGTTSNQRKSITEKYITARKWSDYALFVWNTLHGMVIKAVVASAAAATPATPSSTISVRSAIATATATALDPTTTSSSLFARHSTRWLSPWSTAGVRWYRARPSYGVATPGSVPYDPRNKQAGPKDQDEDRDDTAEPAGTAGPADGIVSKSPFIFETGFAVYAKRPSRAFPPPFLSPPSSSFSEPLSTHDLSQDKRLRFRGERIRALTNGDDAVLASQNFLGVNDGVGAWATRPRGHAA